MTEEGCAVVPDAGPGLSALELRGAVTSYYAEQLYAAAVRLAQGADDVLVRCGDAQHLGGAAVQILVALERALARKGRRLTVEAAAPALVRALRLGGLGA